MIWIVNSLKLELLPPVVSLIRLLKDRGEDVAYLGLDGSDATRKILEELNIPNRTYPFRVITFREHPWERLYQRLTEPILPYMKRRWLWQTMRQMGFNVKTDLIWSAEMESAAILGDDALVLKRRHIHTFYELGEKLGLDYKGFDFHAFAESSTIVHCEFNRAHIFKAEEDLSRLPFVIPNKPYAIAPKRDRQISDPDVAKVIASWGTRHVFLYQGGVQDDRCSLVTILETLCKSFPNAVVAVMGRRTDAIRRLSEMYRNFSYVPFMSPPHHLEVTSHAHIGLAFYESSRAFGLSPLNAVYCAPNKIFEYAGYGMPILGNDIPGLRYSIGAAGAGICLSELSRESVTRAAGTLIERYAEFSSRAKQFYESVELSELVGKILDFARGEKT